MATKTSSQGGDRDETDVLRAFSFLVEAADGTRIVLDPYVSESFDGALRYKPIDEPADVVTASHTHEDHAGTDTCPATAGAGHPTHRRRKVEIKGVQVAHDDEGGGKRGKNTITVVDDGDIRLATWAIWAHARPRHREGGGRVDVLLVPVGGFFTIDHNVAAQVVDSLAPRIVSPCTTRPTKSISLSLALNRSWLPRRRSSHDGIPIHHLLYS